MKLTHSTQPTRQFSSISKSHSMTGRLQTLSLNHSRSTWEHAWYSPWQQVVTRLIRTIYTSLLSTSITHYSVKITWLELKELQVKCVGIPLPTVPCGRRTLIQWSLCHTSSCGMNQVYDSKYSQIAQLIWQRLTRHTRLSSQGRLVSQIWIQYTRMFSHSSSLLKMIAQRTSWLSPRQLLSHSSTTILVKTQKLHPSQQARLQYQNRRYMAQIGALLKLGVLTTTNWKYWTLQQVCTEIWR